MTFVNRLAPEVGPAAEDRMGRQGRGFAHAAEDAVVTVASHFAQDVDEDADAERIEAKCGRLARWRDHVVEGGGVGFFGPGADVIALIVPTCEPSGQPGEVSVISSASVQSSGVAAGLTITPRGKSTWHRAGARSR